MMVRRGDTLCVVDSMSHVPAIYGLAPDAVYQGHEGKSPVTDHKARGIRFAGKNVLTPHLIGLLNLLVDEVKPNANRDFLVLQEILEIVPENSYVKVGGKELLAMDWEKIVGHNILFARFVNGGWVRA